MSPGWMGMDVDHLGARIWRTKSANLVKKMGKSHLHCSSRCGEATVGLGVLFIGRVLTFPPPVYDPPRDLHMERGFVT